MLSRRTFLFFSSAIVAFPLGAFAQAPFTDAAFEAAKASGKPFLIAFHADWCPTCRAQAPVVDSLADKNGFIVLRVDYDGDIDSRRAFDVRQQSTLIVYKGANEVGRAVGITSSDSIAALMQLAL